MGVRPITSKASSACRMNSALKMNQALIEGEAKINAVKKQGVDAFKKSFTKSGNTEAVEPAPPPKATDNNGTGGTETENNNNTGGQAEGAINPEKP